MVNDLSCDIRILAQLSFVLSQIARLTDRQTDGQTGILIARPRLQLCIPCNAVKRFKPLTRNVFVFKFQSCRLINSLNVVLLVTNVFVFFCVAFVAVRQVLLAHVASKCQLATFYQRLEVFSLFS